MPYELSIETERLAAVAGLAGLTANNLAAGLVYVYGDSTAKMDGRQTADAGWATLFAGDSGSHVYNYGVSGQSVAAGAASVLADTANRNRIVIFKDNRNDGETAAQWLAEAAKVVAACPFCLIEPQMGATDGSYDAATLQILADINAGIIAQFPNNTYPADVQAAYIAALSGADTRADGLHRNDLGQSIEALFISAFFRSKGWRREMPETAAACRRMLVQPSAWDRALLNAFIERQVACGRWAKCDALYNALLHDEQAATINLISGNFQLSKIGTVTFTPKRGFVGDGSSGVHSTGFNPALAPAARFTQDNAHLLVHNLTNVAENTADIGSSSLASGSSSFASRNVDNSRSILLNDGSFVYGGGASTSVGRYGIQRKDAANVLTVGGGGQLGSASQASAAPAGGVILWGGNWGSFSTKRRGFASIGAALTDAELRHSYYSEAAFAKAVGAL